MDVDELLFLKNDGNFVITDEFFVKPVPKDSSDFSLLSSIGVHLSNKTVLKRVTITIQDQVLDMFKHCLVSTTPLSYIFLPSLLAEVDKQKRRNMVKSRAVSNVQERTKATTSSTDRLHE